MYPRQWVTETVTPIPKVDMVESEDDIRNISLTEDLSKDFEKFLIDWLEPYVSPMIDPGQFGGRKGNSVTQYLVIITLIITRKYHNQ